MKRILMLLLTTLSLSWTIGAHAVSTMQYMGKGTAIVQGGVYAGLYEVKIDGVVNFAMCDDYNTRIGSTWTAEMYSYSDIQAGAGKFNDGSAAALAKYSQVGWLFSQLSSVDKYGQADINQAIWKIMGGSLTLTDSGAISYFNAATDGTHNNFNFARVMQIYTPNPLTASQELLVAVSPVPVPAAAWLMGSGLLGLVAVARRRSH